ncbi:hypothetical protein GCM10020001_009310 [Nonomuraea salmonea]
MSTGPGSSTPASDQVPQETYAKAGPAAGTAATADAVSCEPTALTGADQPISAATSRRSPPTASPGSRSGGRMPGGRPSCLTSGNAHDLVRTSSSPVVEALVTSAPVSPVSQ